MSTHQTQRTNKSSKRPAQPAPAHRAPETTTPASADIETLEMAISTPSEHTLSPGVVAQLQRTHGNQFVQRLIQRQQRPNPPNPPKADWRSPDNNLFALEMADYPAVESGSDFDIADPAGDAGDAHSGDMIQRVWSDLLLNYTQIDNEKTLGQIRTGKVKWNSIEDWVDKFRSALTKNKQKDAKNALLGLRSRLREDQSDAAKGKLKAPKGIKNFDKVAAQQNAATFFKKWIDATQEHIDHTLNLGWLKDFRNVYIGTTQIITNVDDDSEESSSGNVIDTRSPREIFLANAAELEHMTTGQREGMAVLWDRADQGLRGRITAVLGSTDPSVKMVNSLEYFLEAINLEHIGYEKAISIYDDWLTAVEYYNMDVTFDEWVQKKKDSIEGGRVQHFNEVTREEYRLKPTGKNILTAKDAPLVGDNIYVVTSDDKWYGGGKDRKGTGEGAVHHSSFMGGLPVKCAGHLHTDNSGKLNSIDDTSGHYAPNKANLKRAAATLSNQMDVSEVTISSYTGKGAVALTEFLKMK